MGRTERSPSQSGRGSAYKSQTREPLLLKGSQETWVCGGEEAPGPFCTPNEARRHGEQWQPENGEDLVLCLLSSLSHPPSPSPPCSMRPLLRASLPLYRISFIDFLMSPGFSDLYPSSIICLSSPSEAFMYPLFSLYIHLGVSKTQKPKRMTDCSDTELRPSVEFISGLRGQLQSRLYRTYLFSLPSRSERV